MAERLSLIRQAPSVVLDWSLDAGRSADPLRQACARAEMIQVLDEHVPPEPAPGWGAGLRRWLQRQPERLAAAAVAPGSAGLVWSNMALHFDENPQQSMAAWRLALQVEGFVMFSTLGPGSLSQLRTLYREQGWPTPHAPFVDMHDLGDMLVESGFADPVMDQEVLTLTYADPQALLTDLRHWGVNLSPARFPGCRTPAWRQRLLDGLRGQAGTDGRIRLDFELVYGHAFRAPDRGPAVAERTTVDLEQMKSMLRGSVTRRHES